MKKTVKFLVLVVFIVVMQVLFTGKSYATQSMTGNFYGFTRSGNPAEDMARCAEAQAGRTQASLGYTEAWCADFVCDCARMVGISTDIIPNDGYVPTLVNKVKGTWVSSPQRGDLVFYWCDSCGGYKHVGIMQDGSRSVEGNYWTNDASYCNGSTTIYYDDCWHNCTRKFFRPSYATPVIPTISSCYIEMSNITTTSYEIRCYASSSDGIREVKFPTWTVANGQDDITWENGWYDTSLGCYRYTVKKQAHNYEEGLYVTHVYAYSNSDGSTCVGLAPVQMGSTVANLGDFTARITLKSNSNYVIGTNGTSDGSNLQLETKSTGDKTQMWKFVRNSAGYYNIQNVGTGYYMDVTGATNANYTKMELWTKNESNAQQYYIMKYNGGYRIVAKCTPDWKAVDLNGGSVKNGEIIHLYETNAIDNIAQTWTFDKLTTSISLNKTSTTLTVGGTETLIATVKPSDASKSLSWYTNNSSVATVSNTGVVTAKGVGTATITAATTDGSGLSAKCTVTVKTNTPSIKYSTHVQKEGWQNFVTDGATSGTTGKSLRLEGIKIKLDSTISGGIKYSTHVQKEGWQNFVENGALSGTTGKGYRLEAIKIELTGEIAKQYDIYYRVHAQKFGWMGWAKNGEQSGTQGYGYRLEGIQIKLVKKGEKAPTSTTIAFSICPTLKYSSYVQKEGWKNEVSNGQTMGTTGKSLRMEALKINLKTYGITGGIKYTAHVQKQGWQNYVTSGKVAGTTGKNLRMEAIKIELTEEMAKTFDIYYRVHTEKFGWLGWAKNGEAAGTQGYGYRVEALQIQLLPKGSKPSGSTANAFKQK